MARPKAPDIYSRPLDEFPESGLPAAEHEKCLIASISSNYANRGYSAVVWIGDGSVRVIALSQPEIDPFDPGVDVIHRGIYRSLTSRQRRWLKRRQAVEPAIRHLKSDHRMDRCWLPGKLGDALYSVLCAAGYNLGWLLRAMAQMGLLVLYLCPILIGLLALLTLIQRPSKNPWDGWTAFGAAAK